jgi:hypothetical protein
MQQVTFVTPDDIVRNLTNQENEKKRTQYEIIEIYWTQNHLISQRD